MYNLIMQYVFNKQKLVVLLACVHVYDYYICDERTCSLYEMFIQYWNWVYENGQAEVKIDLTACHFTCINVPQCESL